MNQVFIGILNQSMNAVYLILAVLLIRLLAKRAPKWVTCALWGLVAFRLILPVSLESALSLVPTKEPIPQNIEFVQNPHIETGISAINRIINPFIEQNLSPKPYNSVNPMQVVVHVCAYVWLIGVLFMLAYFCISWLLVRKRVKLSRRYRDNVYISEQIAGPFILGVVRPKIYIPAGLTEEKLEYILEHETAHIKRLDYLWKPLGYLILTVYWFNPLCWISYILLCKDIELACDEKVTMDKDKDWKAMYCQILLDCSAKSKQSRGMTACPIAFGEVSIKDRVKSVLNYKKPAFWIVLVALAACIAAAVCFATSPKQETLYSDSEDLQEDGLATLRLGEYTDELFLNFGGCFFEDADYAEPGHGEGTPKGWYSLGGVGVCIDPGFDEWTEFFDGKLLKYEYLDNHMGCEALSLVEGGGYSGVLYRYEMDLFTMPEIEQKKPEDSLTSAFWVVFFTKGEGEPLYTAFFNSSFFSMDAAVDAAKTLMNMEPTDFFDYAPALRD